MTTIPFFMQSVRHPANSYHSERGKEHNQHVATMHMQVLREAVAKFFPTANGRLLKAAACMFTNTTDHHFIMDLHPRHPQVMLHYLPHHDLGCSGLQYLPFPFELDVCKLLACRDVHVKSAEIVHDEWFGGLNYQDL